jgi:hypothetical protein
MTARPLPSEIDRFVDTARRFCKWCESDKAKIGPDKLQFDALRALADVYRAGFLLPDTDPTELIKPTRLGKDQRKTVARKLEKLPFQYYWRLERPSDFDKPREPQHGDLFDDFLDIYTDVIEGLWLFEDKQIQAAVYFWRLRFAEHWGRRAINALYALHTHALKSAP